MLAIVIPYFKRTFFEATLASLSSQTDQRFKVYIGDDASPEDPADLLEKYKGKFDFIYHRFEDNLGSTSLTQQWERCIALSGNEEWIMILGDDDILGDDVVEKFYEHYDKFNLISNLVRYATIVLNDQTNLKSDLFLHPTLENGLEFFIRKLKGHTRSSLSEYFFRRELYIKHHFVSYPSAFYSDDRAWIDFSDHKPIYSINESIVYIRISDYSLSGGKNLLFLNKAELEYLKYFFYNRLKYFSKIERIFFLKKMENSLYKNKIKNIALWITLYFRFFENFQKAEIIKFHKRLIKAVLKIN